MKSSIIHHPSSILLGLTPAERWSAAQQVNVESRAGYGLMLGAGVALVVLVVLLMWVSHRRWVQSRQRQRERFAEDAGRRGLSARECQVLLAIADRSGLRRPQDVLAREDAFARGMARLLAECARTRTPQENEQLETELAEVREKLGHLTTARSGSPNATDRVWQDSPDVIRRFSLSALTGTPPTAPTRSGAAGPTGSGAAGSSRGDMAADQVLMVFGLTGPTRSGAAGLTRSGAAGPTRSGAAGAMVAGGQDQAPGRGRTVAGVGRVRRCRRTGRGLSLTVELDDVSDAEIADVMQMVSAARSGEDDRRDGDAPQAGPTAGYVKTGPMRSGAAGMPQS